MSIKPVILRALAARDVDEAITYYLKEAGEQAAAGFVAALERGFRHIGRHPASGSMRYAYELGLPGLRAWALRRFPYLIFFIEGEESINVWRVLHGARDIPAWLQEPDRS